MIRTGGLVNRAQRFPLRVPMQYRKDRVSGWQQARTINISRTGILFEAEEKMPADSVLDIRVDLPSKGMMSCLGTVVRIEESACAVRIYRCNLTHS
jgi:hypothetical protein